MNVIKNYVEAMFLNLPRTEELEGLEKDILANMEDKFLGLLEEGKTESEAIGVVISEFGNIDELLEELGLSQDQAEARPRQDEQQEPSLPTLKTEDISPYLKLRKQAGLYIGLGVILCGLMASCLIVGYAYDISVVGFIVGVPLLAIGVALFIISGMRLSPFHYLEKGFILSDQDRGFLEEAKEEFSKSFNLSMVIGVTVCILAILPVLIVTTVFDYTAFGVALTVILGCIGSFFFIYSGNIQGSFTYLLEEGFYEQVSPSTIKKHLFWKKFDNIYWLSVVAFYLLTGFLFGAWGMTWIVFPIAGVLSGIWNHQKS